MREHLNRWKHYFREPLGKAQLRRSLWWAVGIAVVLQMYFVRELIAAEIIFGVFFVGLFFVASAIYLVARLGEQGLRWSESGVRWFGNSARRSGSAWEYFTRKSPARANSESAS
jgi:hypothetical protein